MTVIKGEVIELVEHDKYLGTVLDKKNQSRFSKGEAASFHPEGNELFKCFSCFDECFIEETSSPYLYLLLSDMEIFTQLERTGLLM